LQEFWICLLPFLLFRHLLLPSFVPSTLASSSYQPRKRRDVHIDGKEEKKETNTETETDTKKTKTETRQDDTKTKDLWGRDDQRRIN
jgi:hypothetical protein